MIKIKITDDELQKIKDIHLNFFMNIFPQLTEKEAKILSIENPFDFKNKNGLKKISKNLKIIDAEPQYESFRTHKKTMWCGVKLIEALKVKSCPYCNMSYINTVEYENGNKISEVSFDHYIPKYKYKYLALNLYNLIPACKNCNSSYKTTNKSIVINPFLEEILNDIKFKIVSDETIDSWIKDQETFKIVCQNHCKDSRKTRIENHIDVFKITERYNQYKDIARSIMKKKQIYNETYIDELKNYDLNIKNLPKESVELLLLCQDIYDNNEPFSKFKTDIWNSL